MEVSYGLRTLSLQIPEEKKHGYPFNLPGFENLLELDLHPSVTFFTGENGSGKSTLLEAMAVYLGFNAEGGSKNFHFATRESHSELYKAIRIAKGTKKFRDNYFLRGESFYNVGTEIENLDKEPAGGKVIGAYGGVSLHEQSHGESFWALFTHRFRGNGLYLLDEPEAALSPTRQLAFLIRLHDLVKQNSQFVIVTHSPIILSYSDSFLYEFIGKDIGRTDYRKTTAYSVYQHYLSDPERALHELLKGDSR